MLKPLNFVLALFAVPLKTVPFHFFSNFYVHLFISPGAFYSNCTWTGASVQTSVIAEHSAFVQLFLLWSIFYLWRLTSLIRSSRLFLVKLSVTTMIIYRSVILLEVLQIVWCDKSLPIAKCYRLQPIAIDRNKLISVCQGY